MNYSKRLIDVAQAGTHHLLSWYEEGIKGAIDSGNLVGSFLQIPVIMYKVNTVEIKMISKDEQYLELF